MEDKYWNLDTLTMLDKPLEDFIKNANGGNRIVIDLHKHSCVNRKYPKLEVGKEYWIDVSNTFEPTKYVKCLITYIRSGVIFYKIEHDTSEYFFEEFSIMHYYSEPTELSVNLNNEYYEIKSRSGNMNVNYLEANESN